MIPRVRNKTQRRALNSLQNSQKINLEFFCPTTQKIRIVNEFDPLAASFEDLCPIPLNGQLVDNRETNAANADLHSSHAIQFLKINVGGRSAQISMDSIRQRLDNSRLALFCDKTHIERLTDCDTYFDHSREYYFEKSPTIFEYIIDYYITGKLHRPIEICPIRLKDELDFWRIPVTALAECCRLDELLNFGGMRNKAHGLSHFTNDQVYLESSCPPTLFEGIWMGKLRLIIWTFLGRAGFMFLSISNFAQMLIENPRSSVSAKILSFVSATFVLLSLAAYFPRVICICYLTQKDLDDGVVDVIVDGFKELLHFDENEVVINENNESL